MKKFLSGVKGKQALVSGLAILVLVAGYYRWSVEKNIEVKPVASEALPLEAIEEKNETDSPEEDLDYFARARYERDCARSEATELLKVSVQSGNSEYEMNAEKIAEHVKNMEDETAIENLVKAKGYADCVAFIDESGVSVVVKSESMEKEGVAKIKDIVIEQTGVKATQIKISNKK